MASGTSPVYYTPNDPTGISGVPTLTLYNIGADRSSTPLATAGPGVPQPDGSYRFDITNQPDGTYPTRVTVTFADGSSSDDTNDTITFPLLYSGYATPQQARDAGATGTDQELTSALLSATALVDGFCGQQFTQTTRTVTLHDVRQPLLPLPTPFRDVTAVRVGTQTVNPDQYQVTPEGIRLYPVGSGLYDADGFRTDEGFGTYGNRGSDRRYRYGATATVTATYGPAVPPQLVTQATALLAADLRRQAIATAAGDPTAPVTSLEVEGYKRTFAAALTTVDAAVSITTGNLTVDRMLRTYRRDMVMVG